jgi:hypothetical protein
MRLKLLAILLISSNLVYANDLKIIKTEINHISYDQYLSEIKKVETKSAMCNASANATSGFAGQLTTVSGNVTFVITNNTSTTQNYWVDEYMCVNGFGCTHVRITSVIGAHLSGSGGGLIYNQEMLPKGDFVDQATIQVTGESSCFVQGSNSVWIK